MFPTTNFLAVAIAALIPNIIGALYYGPLFGKAWMASYGMTPDAYKRKNEGLGYALAYVLAFVAAFFLNFFMQMGHKSVNDAGELIFASHNTFGHGAFHGIMMCFGLVVPVVVSLGIFHRASVKNVIFNVAFWLICFAIMGGILDMWR